MIDENVILEALAPQNGWVDTPEQAQLRQCLITTMTGHDALETMVIAGNLIDFIRDQLLASTAEIRRKAARIAKTETGMTAREMADASGQSHQTILRLVTESRR